MEVVVVGGGVIGLAVAWEMASRGAQVTLLERGSVGCGTSWAAAGILPATRPLATGPLANRPLATGQITTPAPRLDASLAMLPASPDALLPSPDAASASRDPLDALRGHSHQLYPLWAQQITNRTGIDVGLRRCGGMYLASTAGEAASLIAALDYWRGDGITAARLTATEVAQWEPAIAQWASSAQFRAAVRVEDEHQVRPPELLRGLAAVCKATGVRIDENVDVGLQRRDGAVVLRRGAERRSEESDPNRTIILCGGVWSGQASAALGLAMSMVPIRGQMLLYRFPAPPFTHIINEGHRYLVPRQDGHVLVGSCEEEVGFTEGTTPQMIDMLAHWAAGLIPELKSMTPMKTWSGLRPATFDGFPIIGRVPEASNLFVAAGHFRSGIHLAPATAVLVADLVERKRPAVDAAPFAVGRMLLPSLDRQSLCIS